MLGIGFILLSTVCSVCNGNDRTSSVSIFEELISETKAADDKAAGFCQANQLGIIREMYSTKCFSLSLSFPKCDIKEVQIKVKHRVLFVQCGNREFIRILPNHYQFSAISWDYSEGNLFISFPYLKSLPTKTNWKCAGGINTSVRNVPRVIGGGCKKDSGGVDTVAAAAAGAGVRDGKDGAEVRSHAYADASDKAVAETATFGSGSIGGPGAKTKVKSLGSSHATGDKKSSAASSTSLTDIYSENDKGDVAAAKGVATAKAFNVGGKKGIGISGAFALTNAYMKKDNKSSTATGVSAATAVNVFGRKINVPLPKKGLNLKIPLSKP